LPNVGMITVSPDGRWIAYGAVTATRNTVTLFVRPMGSVTPQQLSGTEGANSNIFWSPDSRYIGFAAGGKLKKVALSGGVPQNICDVSNFQGGAWNSDGVIVFGSPKGL